MYDTRNTLPNLSMLGVRSHAVAGDYCRKQSAPRPPAGHASVDEEPPPQLPHSRRRDQYRPGLAPARRSSRQFAEPKESSKLPPDASFGEKVALNPRCILVDEDVLSTTKAQRAAMPGFKTWAPVTACATDFVTRELLQSNETLDQMRVVQRIRDTFSPDIEEFIHRHDLRHDAVHFLFKGGNVMRFLMQSLMVQRPELMDGIQNYYMGVFKPSDLDFGIVIDSAQTAGRVGIQEVHALSAKIEKRMVELRTFLVNTETDTFPLLRLSNVALQAGLERVHTEMNAKVDTHNAALASAPPSVPSDEPPTPELPKITSIACLGAYQPSSSRDALRPSPAREDMRITFKDEEETIKKIMHGSDEIPEPARVVCTRGGQPSALYISRNESLCFRYGGKADDGSHKVAHFDLVRLRLAFSLTLAQHGPGEAELKRVGGEIIDISITHTTQDNSVPQFKRLGVSRLKEDPIYTTYSLDVPGPKYSIDSYSIAGIIYDLCRAVFVNTDYPWNAPKYEKRLDRIMGLLLCEAYVEQQGIRNDISVFFPSQEETVGKLQHVMDVMSGCVTGKPRAPPHTIWAHVQEHVDRIRSLRGVPEATTLMERLSELDAINVELLDTDHTDGAVYDMISPTAISK